MKQRSIFVDRAAYMFLDAQRRLQRGDRPLTEREQDLLWEKKLRFCVDGKACLKDGSMGGGDGTAYGKWWSWSIETMTEMLLSAGFSYVDGSEIEEHDIDINLKKPRVSRKRSHALSRSQPTFSR